MTEPTDAEIRELAATGNGVYQDDETAIWEITDPSLMKLVHDALTKWGRPAVAPWRSAVLDLIDECPGLTMGQDQWLSRRVKELDFASAPQPTQAQAENCAVCGHGNARLVVMRSCDVCGSDYEGQSESEVNAVLEQARKSTQAQAGAVPLTCEWTHDENDGFWESACGEAWLFNYGGPADNNVRFCQGCGKPLRIKGGQHVS